MKLRRCRYQDDTNEKGDHDWYKDRAKHDNRIFQKLEAPTQTRSIYFLLKMGIEFGRAI